MAAYSLRPVPGYTGFCISSITKLVKYPEGIQVHFIAQSFRVRSRDQVGPLDRYSSVFIVPDASFVILSTVSTLLSAAKDDRLMYQVSILIRDDLVVGKTTCNLKFSCVLSEIPHC